MVVQRQTRRNAFSSRSLLPESRRQPSNSCFLDKRDSYSAHRAAPIRGWSRPSRLARRTARLAPLGPRSAEMKTFVSMTTTTVSYDSTRAIIVERSPAGRAAGEREGIRLLLLLVRDHRLGAVVGDREDDRGGALLVGAVAGDGSAGGLVVRGHQVLLDGQAGRLELRFVVAGDLFDGVLGADREAAGAPFVGGGSHRALGGGAGVDRQPGRQV